MRRVAVITYICKDGSYRVQLSEEAHTRKRAPGGQETSATAVIAVPSVETY
jgi:hypothetical protein